MEEHAAVTKDMAALFRGEALEEYQRGLRDEGHVLEIDPIWMRLAYVVIAAFIVTALLFAWLVRNA